MTHLPTRDEIDKTIDPKWAVIVLAPSSRREARRWLSLRAESAGLIEERYLDPEKRAPKPKGSGQVRIDQTLTFRVDDLRAADDGRVTVRQSFELSPDRGAPPQVVEEAPPMVAQNPRVLWLRGKDALSRAARIVKELDASKLGRAAVVPAYYLKDVDHRYAVDPWMVEIRPKSPKWTPPEALRQELEFDEQQRVYGGKWIAARFKKPQTDSYEFGCRFRELVGDAATLAFRSLPITARSAASSAPSDLYYFDGPSGTPGQDEPFAAIGMPAMWTAVAALPRSTVHVFLFDLGAENDGPDIFVNDEVSATAIAQPPGVPLPMGEWSPWGGNRHGPQMASIMGATWSVGGTASMAGIFGHLPEISVVSVRCQSLPEMSAGLDHVAWFMKFHPARPTKAVAVFGHDLLWACKVAKASPDPAVQAQVYAFADALEEAQATGADNPDVLAIFPVGNFELTESPTIPNSVNVGSSSLLVGACGLPSQSTRWIGSRWADTSNPPKPSLLAPGQSILAANRSGEYVRVSGTSFAAAHVAGVAAVLRSIKPGKSNLEIANLIRNTATPLTPSVAAAAAGTADPQSGRGRLNCAAAVVVP